MKSRYLSHTYQAQARAAVASVTTSEHRHRYAAMQADERTGSEISASGILGAEAGEGLFVDEAGDKILRVEQQCEKVDGLIVLAMDFAQQIFE